MTSATETMATREKGAFPVSIGTSLALEAAFGQYPERPPVNPPPITAVQNLWINLRTLIRNYVGALPITYRDMIHPDDLVMGLQEELTILDSVVAAGSRGMCNVVFYGCDYSRVQSVFSNAWHKVPHTPKQRAYSTLESLVVKALLVGAHAQDVRKYNFELTNSKLHPASFLISHLPVDLLSRRHFDSLTLLESHTGAIKHPGLWNSKLTNGKEHAHLPFNRFTLQLFGDGVMFQSGPAHLREQVLRLAQLDQWTPVTTMDKIRWSLTHIPNDIERGSLLALM